MNTKQLVEQAKGEIESAILVGTGSGGLLSTGYFSDGPLVDRLRYSEKIDYLLQNLTKGLTVRADRTERNIEPGSNYRTAVLVTNSRLLFVVGRPSGDEAFSIPFDQINNVDVSTGILKDRITVYSQKGMYDMYVQRGSETEDVAAHVMAAADSRRTSSPSAADSTKDATDGLEVTVTDDRNSSPVDYGETDTGTHGTEVAGGDVDPDMSGRVTDQSTEPSNSVAADEVHEPVDKDQNLSTCSAAFEAVFFSDQEADDSGLDTDGIQETYSKGEILDKIAAVAEHVERPPKVKDMQEYGDISPSPAYRYIDSWSDAVAAGIESNGEANNKQACEASNGASITDSKGKGGAAGQTSADTGTTSATVGRTSAEGDLLDDIRRVENDLGQVPSKTEMSFHGQHAISQFEKAFGTWSGAVRAAGFEPRGSQDSYTREEVLEGLRDIGSELQKPPSNKDINERAPFGAGVIYNYFDSISDARAAAGVDKIESDSETDSNTSPDVGVMDSSSPSPSASDTNDSSRDSTDDSPSLPSDCPLADGLAKASEGRLSGVAVEVIDVIDVEGSRRAAEVDLRTTADEVVVLDIWETHDVDWSFEQGDRLRLDEILLKRWEKGSTPAHQLSTTKDFSAISLEDASGDTRDTPVERLTGLAGATKDDAEILVEAGYESRDDLTAATLSELRDIPDLDDGVALRIKAELG